MGLVRSLPSRFISLPNKKIAKYQVIHPQVELALSKERGATYLYNLILAKKTESVKNVWECKWDDLFGEINWEETFKSICNNTSVYFHILSYKIIRYANCDYGQKVIPIKLV